jgi:O-antigen/teichoic acid export membrane protein
MSLQAILNRIIQGDERTVLIKKNILGTFFIKGTNVVISLLYIPITLSYLNQTRYGVWMTLISIVAWMGLFDVGLGSGLRNKLGEAFAIKDFERARKYVSTVYAMIFLIVICVLILFYIANYWINWSIVLNTPESYRGELKNLAIIVVTLFGSKFILNIISTVFIADQLPAFGSTFELSGNILGLLSIWILTLTGKTSLILFGLASMLSPIFVYIVASIYFYKNKYSYLKPEFRSIDLSYAKNLIGLGIQFFAIQIATLIIFQSSNILIAQLFSPSEVTLYNVSYKYFSLPMMLWNIIMAPLWSAFTNAMTLKDIDWMRKMILKLNRYIIPTVFVIILMAVFAQPIISFWTSGRILIKPIMSWIFALYAFISIWNNIYVCFLNGISKIKIPIITSILASLLHIPLAIFFVRKLGIGSEGVVLSMAISLSFFSIMGPIQSFRIINSLEKNLR